MAEELSPIDTAKRAAAGLAAEAVEDGMTIGLGSGSTAAWLVRWLGERIQSEGLTIKGVPTSVSTAELARKASIPIIPLDEAPRLDLTIDGADEFDPDLNMVKGGGGALLREKIVAMASDRVIIIADDSKRVERLGRFPLPVEILPFGRLATIALVEQTLARFGMKDREVKQRHSGHTPFITDGGNYVLDLHLNRIEDPYRLNRDLNALPGVIENGLFVDICDVMVVGHGDGKIDVNDSQGSGR